MLGLFYGLALHMYLSLGGWPNSIGELGFPKMLLVHGWVQTQFCILLVLLTLFAGPVALVISLFVPRWRIAAPYLTAYLLFCFVGWGLMMLAPAGFLHWWWD